MLQERGQSRPSLRSWRRTADPVRRTSLPFQGPENKTTNCKVWYGFNTLRCEVGGAKITLELGLFLSSKTFPNSYWLFTLTKRARKPILMGSGCYVVQGVEEKRRKKTEVTNKEGAKDSGKKNQSRWLVFVCLRVNGNELQVMAGNSKHWPRRLPPNVSLTDQGTRTS